MYQLHKTQRSWKESLKGKVSKGEMLGFADISLGWIVDMVDLLEKILKLKMIDEVTFSSHFCMDKKILTPLS